MICLDCAHSIIRTAILMDREEHELSCAVDGKRILVNVTKCSRHQKEKQPELREEMVFNPQNKFKKVR